jgi:hypothetical protein
LAPWTVAELGVPVNHFDALTWAKGVVNAATLA